MTYTRMHNIYCIPLAVDLIKRSSPFDSTLLLKVLNFRVTEKKK